jgi:hypothetical protein
MTDQEQAIEAVKRVVGNAECILTYLGTVGKTSVVLYVPLHGHEYRAYLVDLGAWSPNEVVGIFTWPEARALGKILEDVK